MTSQNSSGGPARPAGRHWLSILLGFLLLLPAAVCCGTTLFAPTVQTFVLSEQSANGLGPARFVGPANYARLAELPPTGRAVSFTLEIAVVRLLAVVIVPVVLALAAGALGGWVRGGLRLLFSLPLALFAPTGLAVAWLVARTPNSNPLGTVAGAQGTLLFIDGAQVLGLACGVGLITYVAAVRIRTGGAAGWRGVRGPLLLTWIVSALAALATALQTFTLPYLLTHGGPAFGTATLMLLQYQLAFVGLQFGQAAAVAILNLAPLVVLGLLAGLLVVLSGARFEHAPAAGPSSPLMPVVLAVSLVVVLGLAAFGLWASGQGPMFQTARLALTGESQRAAGNAFGNSLVGPLAVLFVQLPLAYLAALGIGALRPLRRWSEWLLLPFSPWLFVTVGPLSVAAFMRLQQSGLINTTSALLPPILLSVPMLFVLTMFFKGRAASWRSARAAGRPVVRAFFGEVIAPSVPLALLLGVLGVLAGNQELLWSLVAGAKLGLYTGNVALATLAAQFSARGAALAAGVVTVVLPGFVFGFVALAVFQLAYVERLALRTGPVPDEPSQ